MDIVNIDLAIYGKYPFGRFHSSILDPFSCMPVQRVEHMPRTAMGICMLLIQDFAFHLFFFLIFVSPLMLIIIHCPNPLLYFIV